MRNLLILILLLMSPAWALNLTLNQGWNAVALQTRTVTQLTPGPGVSGMVYYDGTGYQSRSFDLASVNADGGPYRGLWVYCQAATQVSYEGTPTGAQSLPLRAGWNLVAFPESQPIPGSQLTREGVLTTFYEISSTGGYNVVDVAGGGTLTPGRPCWVFASRAGQLSWGTAGSSLTIGAATGQSLQPLLGVNGGPAPTVNTTNAELTTSYRTLGVRQVRPHDFAALDMSLMYPDKTRNPDDPASFDFSQSDATYRSVVDNGFELYFRLGDSAERVSAPTNETERANWVRAGVNVLRHYRQGQWNGFQGTFPCVEIWNEPNSSHFWPGTRDDFFKLYADAALAIKAAFPELKVGGPGMAGSGANSQVWTQTFLDYVRQRNAPLDFYSWHLYSNNPDDYAALAASNRSALDQRGFTGVPLHCTEFNTDNDNNTLGFPGSDLRTKAIGAALVTGAWIRLQQNNQAQAYFYRGPDSRFPDSELYGLFFADGRRKKSADAFQLWSELVKYPQVLTSTAVSGVYTLAGRDAQGRTAILLANPGSSAQTMALGGVSFSSMSRMRVSDAAEGIVTDSPGDTTVTLEARSVQLLVLTP